MNIPIQTSLWFRALLFIAFFLSVFLLPSWLVFCLLLVPVFFFERYYEFFLIVLLLDVSYGLVFVPPMNPFESFFYLSIGFVLYLSLYFLRRQLFVSR